VLRANHGGAEIECSLLFADVRGSTTLAERMSPSDFNRLMGRFFDAATSVLIDEGAMVDKFVREIARSVAHAVGPHDRELRYDRRLVAAALDIGRERLEGRYLAQDSAWLLSFVHDVHEAHAIGKPERGVVKTVRPLAIELLIHGPDEGLVLIGLVRPDLVADHRAGHV
jgi:hypothetical protein